MNKLRELLEARFIDLTDKEYQDLSDFKDLVLKWNKKFNITAITESDEFDLKHLLDCLLLLKCPQMTKAKTIVDVGTGGGFPGIPMKITMPEADFTLVDSMNKRIRFIQVVIEELGLEKIKALHARSEELSRDKPYRDGFDVCVSRAVASLDTLCEYCLPLVKPGGYFISMKGSKAQEELEEAKNAIRLLNGKLVDVTNYSLFEGDHQRALIVIEKTGPTPKRFPRGQGKEKNKPL